MYEKLYNMQEVMCVQSNNPVDWMVVWYYTVMMEDNYDKGSYIVKMKPKCDEHVPLDKMIPPFEGPIEGFKQSITRGYGEKL